MERNEIRCGCCGKLLGKGEALDMEIKCPRCKTINHVRTQSSSQEPPDDHSESTDGRIH